MELSYVADSSQRALKIAKAVAVTYGEPSGPPLIATKDAMDKKALIPEIKVTLVSGDTQSNSLTFFFLPHLTNAILLCLVSYSCYIRVRCQYQRSDRVWQPVPLHHGDPEFLTAGNVFAAVSFKPVSH